MTALCSAHTTALRYITQQCTIILRYISAWSAKHPLWVALHGIHVMFVHYHDGRVVLYGSAQCRTPKYTTAGVRRYVMCVQCNMTASNMSPQDPTTHQPLNPCCHNMTQMHIGLYSYPVPCMRPSISISKPKSIYPCSGGDSAFGDQKVTPSNMYLAE